jgi:hypothetical protein
LWDPISKMSITKKGWQKWLKVRTLSSNPSTTKKKKKEESIPVRQARQIDFLNSLQSWVHTEST